MQSLLCIALVLIFAAILVCAGAFTVNVSFYYIGSAAPKAQICAFSPGGPIGSPGMLCIPAPATKNKVRPRKLPSAANFAAELKNSMNLSTAPTVLLTWCGELPPSFL